MSRPQRLPPLHTGESCFKGALACAARDWFSFPADLRNGEKKSHKKAEHSNGSKWGMTKDTAEIKRDFDMWPDAGLGIPTGWVNKLFVLEIDTKEGHDVDGKASLVALELKYGSLPQTLMGRSPTGSEHYYFLHPGEGIRVRNTTSELGAGLDTRGDGGMVIAPPSMRPGKGRYAWVNHIDPAPAPDWLLMLLCESREKGHEHEEEHPPISIEEADAALQVIPNDEKRWLELRLPKYAGWDRWNHVAMAIYAATGGGDKGRELFHKYSSRWVSSGGKVYSRVSTNERWDELSGCPPTQITAGKLIYLANVADPEWRTRFQFEHVTPVDLWATFDPPPLPRGLLPETIERFAFRQGEVMGADPAGLAVSALVVCAAAIPDHVMLQPKKYDHSWTEPARIWAALVGPPSVMKTPTINQVTKPLARIDHRMFREYLEAKKHYDTLPKEERQATPPPPRPRLRLDDTTIEAAQDVLRESPNGLLCIQDELGGWFGSMDKYSGGHRGAMKDRGFWLRAWNGNDYHVDRVGRGSYTIPNLSVCMLGGIQPDAIRRVAAEAVDDGLLQRLFPIVLRPATMGRDEPTGVEVRRYEELVERLHEIYRTGIVLKFDDGALAIREKLEHRHLNLMQCEAINRKLGAHIIKYNGLFARLCVLWHCIEHAETPPQLFEPDRPAGVRPLSAVVSRQTAQRVADFLHNFLLRHALAFYGMLGLSDEHDRLQAVAGYILARKLERVTNRDVQRSARSMRKLARKDVEPVLEQLDTLGWVSRVVSGPRTSDARWIVNPECHRLYEERAKSEAERRKRDREMLTELLGKGTQSE